MITLVTTKKGSPAITSDHWHVVHSRFLGALHAPSFRRHVISEHADRAECMAAARAFVGKLRMEAGKVPLEERDEVFARRPGYKSLAEARRRVHGRPSKS